MKNFLELPDIEQISIELVINPVFDLFAPKVAIKINNQILFAGTMNSTMQFKVQHELQSPIGISIELLNKKYSLEHETAVLINHITIDDIKVIPEHVDQSVYTNDHHYTQPTNYMGFNGIWSLDIDRPFYQWLHLTTAQGWLLEP
jgi:hypothetical protein